MKLDPVLRDVLACPCDLHAPVRMGTVDEPEAEIIQCTACLSTFPVRDGIPVMLLDEATPGPKGIGVRVEGSEG